MREIYVKQRYKIMHDRKFNQYDYVADHSFDSIVNIFAELKLSNVFDCHSDEEALDKFLRTTSMSYKQLEDYLIKRPKEKLIKFLKTKYVSDERLNNYLIRKSEEGKYTY